jgi:hypothetical protein
VRRASAFVILTILGLTALYSFPGRVAAAGSITITAVQIQDNIPTQGRFEVYVSISYYFYQVFASQAVVQVWITDPATGQVISNMAGENVQGNYVRNYGSVKLTVLVPVGSRLMRIHATLRTLYSGTAEDVKDFNVLSGLLTEIPEFDSAFLLLGVLATFIVILQRNRNKKKVVKT